MSAIVSDPDFDPRQKTRKELLEIVWINYLRGVDPLLSCNHLGLDPCVGFRYVLSRVAEDHRDLVAELSAELERERSKSGELAEALETAATLFGKRGG